jgi:hypothetical protein
MIKTFHKVFYCKKGVDTEVGEFESIRDAKALDKQMETVGSFLVEAERLIEHNTIVLPKGIKQNDLENILEDIFIQFASNPEGLKRALKGEPMTLQEPVTKRTVRKGRTAS